MDMTRLLIVLVLCRVFVLHAGGVETVFTATCAWSFLLFLLLFLVTMLMTMMMIQLLPSLDHSIPKYEVLQYFVQYCTSSSTKIEFLLITLRR